LPKAFQCTAVIKHEVLSFIWLAKRAPL